MATGATSLFVSALFLTFVLGLAWPRGKTQWRNAGLYSAFLISLFFEMFGLPLTIFLLSPLVNVPILAFDMGRSHLWAYLLDRSGVIPLGLGVYLVMAISMSLLALGWIEVYAARDELATKGIYRFVRHPQYLGLILVLVAFNIQWPTLLTLLMAPLLIVAYVRQARREDVPLANMFGTEFLTYRDRVPAFVPRFQGHHLAVPNRDIWNVDQARRRFRSSTSPDVSSRTCLRRRIWWCRHTDSRRTPCSRLAPTPKTLILPHPRLDHPVAGTSRVCRVIRVARAENGLMPVRTPGMQ